MRGHLFRRLSVLLALGLAGQLGGADWPLWRYDANRSAATPHAGPREPRLAWQLDGGTPEPAYDHQFRMCADAAPAPVAAGGLLFLPATAEDGVIAWDLRTGVRRWRFATEGPVRFAPACADGLVIFGADDGLLYAVRQGNGELVWKVRGCPADRPDVRLLINGRLCSRWPVRGGPVAADGTVYVAAGIWPEEGVYTAAVRVATGNVLWRSDAMSYVPQGMSDHGKAYDLSLPPHGYLAIIDGRLAVPSGRSLAAWFDPADGSMEPYTSYYVKTNPPRGTWHVSGIGSYVVQGGNWFATRAEAAPAVPPGLESAAPAVYWSRESPPAEQAAVRRRPFLRADTYRLHNENLYTDPVLAEGIAYASEFDDERQYLVPRGKTHLSFPVFDRIVARDLTRPRWTGVRQVNLAYGREPVTVLRLDFPVLWELPSPLRVLLKAGSCLYAGGADTVAAIAIPAAGEPPRVLWEAPVSGTPVQALVADAHLVVVTHTGVVHVFGDGGAAPAAMPARPPEAAGSSPRSPRGGHACVAGWGDGSYALDLARRQECRVVVVEADPAVAEQARAMVARAGLQASRVQVLAKPLSTLTLAPYWAAQAVLQDQDGHGPPEAALAQLAAVLRPGNGTLRVPAGLHLRPAAERLLSGQPDFALAASGSDLVIRRISAPPGSADWTHESGGADNRFASSDANVAWPLGVLWYSGDIDRWFTPPTHFQHERNPYPVVAGGRMFLITGRHLHAIDIYTGSYLWQAELPLTPWVESRFFDSRVYGRPTERNIATAEDKVYTVLGDAIQVYHADSGEAALTLTIPADLREQAQGPEHQPQEAAFQGHRGRLQAAPQWTEVRLWNDVLVALLGKHLAAFDRHTGTVIWTRPSRCGTTTCAIGPELLFTLDCDTPPMGGDAGVASRQGWLAALDPTTGAARWEKGIDIPPVPRHETSIPRPWLTPILPTLVHHAAQGLLLAVVNRNGILAFRAADGAAVWERAATPPADLQGVYPPVVTDDHVVLSQSEGVFARLLDVRTGQPLGPDRAIPRPRTCARILGNTNLLIYRDAATELYDIPGNRMIGLNSVRSGCTTSFIPAGGILTAPMLGHGCVCNYPMFASLALFHWPRADTLRPTNVTASWTNQAGAATAPPSTATTRPATGAATGPVAVTPDAPLAALAAQTDGLQLLNCSVTSEPNGIVLRTGGTERGYAVRQAPVPLTAATFSFTVQRVPSQGRHDNAFFVCGDGPSPENWIACEIYYGGRSSLAIAGPRVAAAERKVTFTRRDRIEVTVAVDLAGGTVTLAANGESVTTRLTSLPAAITHYGCGGANSDNRFSAIQVQ